MTKYDFYLHDLASKYRKINPKKYYLSYSGGKDSHLLFWFQKTWLPFFYPDMKAYAKIPIVSVNTRMEFPEILDRMIKNADVILTPKMFPHEVIAQYGTPCFSKKNDEYIEMYQKGSRCPSILKLVFGYDHNGVQSRFQLSKFQRELLLSGNLPKISPKCCEYLKKEPFHEFAKKNQLISIMGMVGSESIRRKTLYKSCFSKGGKFTPLWDLTEDVENEIYQQYHIDVPKIYNYVDQTGCAGCPYGIGKGHTEKELALMTPAKKKYVCEMFKDAYRIRGVNTNAPLQTVIEDFLPRETELPFEEK